MGAVSIANQSGSDVYAAVPGASGGSTLHLIADGAQDTWSDDGNYVAFVWKGSLVTGGTPDAHVIVSGETLVVS
jgi:hypothetical protein